MTRPDTVNHALVEERLARLVICAHDRLEVCTIDGKVIRETSHPWFAGGHTIYRDALGNYVVSCSAADAVLTIDHLTLDVVRAWRIPPTLYGGNYSLRTSDDVRRHYVDTDSQIAHINSAVPRDTGVLLTCFIQGSLVWVNRYGKCTELVSGFVGCHGGRVTDHGRIYFADSPNGDIVWLADDHRVLATVSCNSIWLHDVVSLWGDYYACAVGDRNELTILDATSGRILQIESLDAFGSTPCLLSSGHL